MDLLMPQLGETVAEGKITKWFKSVGDAVKPGDNLFEIETDKVTMEVPSTVAGTLSEVRVTAGEVAPVGAIVGIIADGAGAAATAPLPAASKAPPARGSHRAGCGTVQRFSRQRSIRSLKCARRTAISARQSFREDLDHATGAASRQRSRHRSLPPARHRPARSYRRA